MAHQGQTLGETNSRFFHTDNIRHYPFHPRPRPPQPPSPRRRPPVVIIRDRTLPQRPIVYSSPVYYYYPYSSYDASSNINFCPPQRPNVCTTEYAPVCGTFTNGTAGTFSNSCNACLNPSIQYFKQGSCI